MPLPLPSREQRFTVEFTFHGGESLPIADVHNLSSDPYIHAVLTVPEFPRNNRDDPLLTWRTPTVRHTRDPVWESKWRVSGIPASGFHLSMKAKDEDTRDRDDRLGKAYLDLGKEEIYDGFELKHHKAVVMKRKGSFVPYAMTYLTAILPGQKLILHPRVDLSVRVFAMNDAKDCPLDRAWTSGPNKYSRHFSPLIGRVVKSELSEVDGGTNKRVSTSSFVANKLQLTGPVPSTLHHRFVPYRPFIDWLFLKTGPWGWILNIGLHKQYRTVYSYDKHTVYGVINSSNDLPSNDKESKALSKDMASVFLQMTSYGEGGRLFTYIITLDGEWRFSETGKEFAIDLLSKHSMHADLAKEIAFSGEFFVRRKADVPQPSSQNEDIPHTGTPDVDGDHPDPKQYELVIDNDSGTYRPKKELLPTLQEWLSNVHNLGGLGGILAMDGFDKTLEKWKDERKEQKAAHKGEASNGKVKLARSGSSVSSISNDDSELGGGGSVGSNEIEAAIREHEEQEQGQHELKVDA